MWNHCKWLVNYSLSKLWMYIQTLFLLFSHLNMWWVNYFILFESLRRTIDRPNCVEEFLVAGASCDLASFFAWVVTQNLQLVVSFGCKSRRLKVGNGVKTVSGICNGKVMMGRVEFIACLKVAVGRLFYSTIWCLYLPVVFNLDSTLFWSWGLITSVCPCSPCSSLEVKEVRRPGWNCSFHFLFIFLNLFSTEQEVTMSLSR